MAPRSPGLRVLRSLVLAAGIVSTAAGQDSRPAATLQDLLGAAVSNDASARESAGQALGSRADLVREASAALARDLAGTRDESWLRRARAASAVAFGARGRLEAHLGGGGKRDDDAGRDLAATLASAAALLVPPLRQALDDPGAPVRAEAIRAIGSFGEGASEILPDLVVISESGGEGVERELVFALGWMRCSDPRVLPFVDACLGSANDAVRRNATFVACHLGPKGTRLVPPLGKIVANPDEKLPARLNAAIALRSMRGRARDALDDLASALDPKAAPELVVDVTGAIADILNGLALSAAKDGGEKDETRVAITEDEWERIRGAYAPSVVGKLGRIARGRDRMATWCSAVALGWLGDDGVRAAPDLIAAAEFHEGETLLNVLWALDQYRFAKLPIAALVPAIRALEIGPDGARIHAAGIVASLAREEARVTEAGDLLLQHAGSAQREVARASLGALREMAAAAKPWAKGLVTLLHHEAPDEAKLPIIEALSEIEPSLIGDRPLLMRLLASPDFWTQRSALLALGLSGQIDAANEDAVMPVIRETTSRWGSSDVARFATRLRPSPKLAALFLELARKPDGYVDVGWVPALQATGVPNATIAQLVEDATNKPWSSADAKEALEAGASLRVGSDARVRFYAEHLDLSNRDRSEAAIGLLEKLGGEAQSAIPALWTFQVAVLDAADGAASRPDDGLARYPDMKALQAIEKIGGASALVPRIREELARRSGISRRVLLDAAIRVDPGSAETAAAVRAMLASTDEDDRGAAIDALRALPDFPKRIETLEGLVPAGGDAANKALDALMELAPASSVLARALENALTNGPDDLAASAIAWFERKDSVPSSFEGARERLLGSTNHWHHEAALASLGRRKSSRAPAAAGLAAFARAAKTREDRLIAAWSATRAADPVPREFFEAAAPWLEWSDPPLALLLLPAAGRNAARAEAVAARLPAFLQGRPKTADPPDETGERRFDRFEAELFDATLVAVARFGPRASAVAKVLEAALAGAPIDPARMRRAIEGASGPPRRRATVDVAAGALAPGTAWGARAAERPRPEPRPGRFADGSFRFVIDDGGEKAGAWIEFYVDRGPKDDVVIELLAYRFDQDASPIVKSVPIDDAAVSWTAPTSAGAAVLAGSFRLRSGDSTLAGRFHVRNPLAAAPESRPGERR